MNNDNFTDVTTYFERLQYVDDEMANLESRRETILEEMRADHGATFEHEGQFYQVGTRSNKNTNTTKTFLKRLPGPPKSYIKGMPKGGWKNREVSQQVSASSHEPSHEPSQESSQEDEYYGHNSTFYYNRESTEEQSLSVEAVPAEETEEESVEAPLYL